MLIVDGFGFQMAGPGRGGALGALGFQVAGRCISSREGGQRSRLLSHHLLVSCFFVQGISYTIEPLSHGLASQAVWSEAVGSYLRGAARQGEIGPHNRTPCRNMVQPRSRGYRRDSTAFNSLKGATQSDDAVGVVGMGCGEEGGLKWKRSCGCVLLGWKGLGLGL